MHGVMLEWQVLLKVSPFMVPAEESQKVSMHYSPDHGIA